MITRKKIFSAKGRKTMNKEYEMSFPLMDARMHFLIETVDGEEETCVMVCEGFELIERMKQYVTEDYKKLFEDETMHVHYARLRYIEYNHEQNGVKINLKIDGDDVSMANVKFDTHVLEDENAKKVAMIREVLDFDHEAETSLLRELFR